MINLLAPVVVLTLAQAQPAPVVPPAPTQPSGLMLSIGVGVGVLLGKVDGANEAGSGVLEGVAKALPFTLAAGYRFNPRWSTDLNLTYAPIQLAGSCAMYDASARDTHLGATLRWYRPSPGSVRSWVALGFGYEQFHFVGSCPDVELGGVDLDFQLGSDFYVSSTFTVGPFASARMGTFLRKYVHSHSRSAVGIAPTTQTISEGDQALHGWFSLGLRGTFAATPTPIASAGSADYRSGLLFLPFLGATRPAGDTFDLGVRAGFLVGYHVLPFFSVNGELAIDRLHANYTPAEDYLKAYVAELVLSPLYHLPFAWGAIVAGPRLGGFRTTFSDYNYEEHARGLAYGLNLGVFLTTGDLALGTLFSYTQRHTTRTDVKTDLNRPWGNVPDVWSATFAALF